MAQFGGNKNPPWAQGGRAGQPGGGAVDVPGLAGVFGATAAAGPPPSVFHPQGGPPTGIPPGLAGVGHLGVNHGPAVTLAAMASQPVSSSFFLFSFSSLFFQPKIVDV